jgi:predicted glycosyltransferase
MVDRKKYRFVVTAHYQANIIAWLKRIPNIAFSDDPRKYVFPVLKVVADKVYLPPFGTQYKGIRVFQALKEWAYLSPRYFFPDLQVLRDYGLESKKYIFLREVSTKTSNYLHQAEDSILSIAKSFPEEWKVVLSLENKKKKDQYPSNWLILEEPVSSIHSLMYHSLAIVSSGDSMAREGAILGVPSIYAGSREMPANQIMIDKGMLVKVKPTEVVGTIQKVLDGKLCNKEQSQFREGLSREWEDITRMTINKVNNTTNQSSSSDVEPRLEKT